MKPGEISVSAKLTQSAAVFIVTLIMSLLLLSKAAPIALDEHFQIGQNLRSTGRLTIDGVSSILRPPGLPGFVAASLWIGDAIAPLNATAPDRDSARDQRIVVTARPVAWSDGGRAVLLGFWCGWVPAAGIASAAARNPYSLALANLVSCHLLFVVLTIFSTLGQLSLRRVLASASAAAGGGMLWGLTSLVKPVALVIPVFVAPLMLLRLPVRPVVRSLA